jgi:LacI family transcriptional regulator
LKKKKAPQKHGLGTVQSPTIRDVARTAGVSAATVSRVFNHPNIVSDAVNQKVREAISSLEYMPNGSARALASKTTKTAGAVMPTIDGAIFSKMIGSMQQALEEQGFVLLVAAHEYSLSRELSSVQALIQRGIDAIILVGKFHHPAVYELIERKGIPLVLTCIYEPSGVWPTVGWDNKAGAFKIATYLAEIGHRSFGIIGGILKDNDRATDRVNGFISALKAHDIIVSGDDVLECRYDLAESGRALCHFLERPNPPTAILCGNDVLATGAVLECLRQGVKVPENISITGYDNLELAAHLVPPLTTLRVPAARVGRLAVETLLRIFGKTPTPLHVGVDIDLILRGTTSPPS